MAPHGGEIASAEEREAARRHGVEGFACDVLAWRRSALVVATAVVFASAVAMSVDLLLRWDHHARGRTELGKVLDLVLLHGVAPWIVVLLCAGALAWWTRWSRSRWLVLVAAAVEVLPAFAIAMLPPSWMFTAEQDALGLLGFHALRLATAVGLALRITGVLS